MHRFEPIFVKLAGLVVAVLAILWFYATSSTVKAQNVVSSPAPSTSPTATPFSVQFDFPGCQNFIQNDGDVAHYAYGLHQIVGGPLLWGSDDVYSLDQGNFLQCFCPEEGFEGIQTNWLRSNDPIVGWFFENGSQWNLGNFMYAAQNIDFSCQPPQTPDPTPTPTLFDACPNVDGVQASVPEGWFQLDPPSLECRPFQYGGPESSHVENPGTPVIEGYGTGGQILGASTMAGTGTFAEKFYLIIMILGGTLSFLGIKNIKKV